MNIVHSLKKIALTFLVILIFTTFLGCTSNNKEVENKKPLYKVFKKEDISIGDIKRYAYYIIVDEKLNKEELEKIANEVVETAKQESQFNGIKVLMYDGEYSCKAESIPPLGTYTFAPNGDIVKAMDVLPGEYEKMSGLSEIKEPKWNLKPNEKEQKIIEAYNALYLQESVKEGSCVVSGEDIKKKTAEIMQISEDDVSKALESFKKWILSN